MIAGEKNKVKEFLSKIIKIDKLIGQDFFYLDQIIVNYVLRKEYKINFLPQEFNYSLITNSGHFKIKNNIIQDKSIKKIIVVHNTGSDNRIFANGREDFNFPKKDYKKLNGEIWGITSYYNPASSNSRYTGNLW